MRRCDFVGLAQAGRKNPCRAIVVALLLLSSACSAAVAADSKRVMLLHSFGRDFKPWSDYANAIRTELELQSPWPLDITDHSLVTARSDDENPEMPFVEYLRALFAKRPLDLIVSIGAPAASFVQRHRHHLFASTPMVLTAVEQRRVRYSTLTANDAVVAVWINYLAAMKNILQVLPDTERVTVVVGTSPIEKFWREEIEKEAKPLADRVAFAWTDHLSFNDLLKHAATLPPRSAIFWELMIVDAAGVVHDGDTGLTKLHAVANAPIFSYDDSFFGRELVGGPMLSVLEGSRQTAAVAIRILGGEKAGDINPPVVEFAKPKFDWREMQRWGISESRLPPGSEVHFRSPTMWEQYRLHILAAFAAFLVQGALIAWLVYEHWRRHNAEVKVRTALAELAHMNRAATVGEMTASIAHEIRQPLAAVAVAGHTALNWLNRQVPDIEEARVALQNVIQETHRADDVIKNIRAMFKKEDETPRTTLDLNDLIEHVLVLAKTAIDSNHIVLETDLMDRPPPLVLGDAIQLQQVLLNLVNNAVEAMGSSDRARVLQIRTDTSSIQVALITVADSGPGIDPKIADKLFEPFVSTKTGGMGMGLSICKSIIEAHDGQLTAGPAKPHGTLFVIALPIWRPDV